MLLELLAQVPGPGETAPVPEGPAAGFIPLYLSALALLSPLIGYVLNHYAPWASEQAKGVVQAVLAAGVGVLYQAVTPGSLGLNDETLYAVLIAMGTALVGHFGYKVAGFNTLLGAGTNSDGKPPVVHAGLSGKGSGNQG